MGKKKKIIIIVRQKGKLCLSCSTFLSQFQAIETQQFLNNTVVLSTPSILWVEWKESHKISSYSLLSYQNYKTNVCFFPVHCASDKAVKHAAQKGCGVSSSQSYLDVALGTQFLVGSDRPRSPWKPQPFSGALTSVSPNSNSIPLFKIKACIYVNRLSFYLTR